LIRIISGYLLSKRIFQKNYHSIKKQEEHVLIKHDRDFRTPLKTTSEKPEKIHVSQHEIEKVSGKSVIILKNTIRKIRFFLAGGYNHYRLLEICQQNEDMRFSSLNDIKSSTIRTAFLIMSGRKKAINSGKIRSRDLIYHYNSRFPLRLSFLTSHSRHIPHHLSVGNPTDDSEIAKFLTGVVENR
jgi:hypothetical protein